MLDSMTRSLRRPETAAWRVAAAAAGTALFALLTGVSAHVRIPLPFTPVPVTMQTFTVLLAGIVLGPSLGAASQALYIMLGAAGLPLFAGGATGLAYLGGPTSGYLMGFVAAAAFVGYIAKRSQKPLALALAVTTGMGLVYLFGAAWLAWGIGIGLHRAVALGVVPFLAGDAVKAGMLMAAGVLTGRK